MTWTEEQQFFQESTRKFIEAELPLTRVRELAGDPDGFDRSAWKRAAELGWTSLLVPEALGGGSLGGELEDLSILAEEVGRGVCPGPLLPTNVVAAAISRSGSDAQQQALLPGLLSGERVAAWAYLEVDGAWRPEDLRLEATRRGDDFVLNGCKHAVEAGLQADQLLVTARGEAGLSQFVVPADTPGVRRSKLEGLDFVKRFAAIDFDDVAVSRDALVGPEGAAGGDVERQLQIALVLQCSESAGAAAAVFESTLVYMFDRFSFGRPLASYQALKHRFADMKMWLEASHAIAEGAARAVHSSSSDAAEFASAAKAYVGDQSIAIIQDCIQMHGGMGVTWEHDAHLFLRRVTQNRGLYGSPVEHREAIAVLLGMDDEVEGAT